MRVFSVHNKYQIRGGEDESRESEERLLRDMGHTVDVYDEDNERIASLNMWHLASKTIWSIETYNNVVHRLQSEKYDIVQVQNFFPLISPSIHYAAKEQGIPVVQTLRNYRLLCPNALFFRDGQICEDCMGKFIPYPSIAHNCYKGDRIASGATASMLVAHRVLGTWIKVVDCFIALSHFSRDKFIEGGFPPDKIFVKPNFVYPDPGVGTGSGNYALFVGRLSVEKGLDTLLNAWSMLNYPFSLKIIGNGPLSEQVMKAIQAYPNIEWLGHRPISEVHEMMGNAKFLIFPSKWYETFGRVIVEAFAKGTPAIATNIGAISELIDDTRTGLLFKLGDSSDLATKVDWLISHPSSLIEMRQEARREFEAKYTAEINYQRLIEIYESVRR